MEATDPAASPVENSEHKATIYVSESLTADLRKSPLGNFANTHPVGPDLGPESGSVYDMYIGKEAATSSNRYFNGYIDEIVIYDYVLTDDEIGSWYNATRGYY